MNLTLQKSRDSDSGVIERRDSSAALDQKLETETEFLATHFCSQVLLRRPIRNWKLKLSFIAVFSQREGPAKVVNSSRRVRAKVVNSSVLGGGLQVSMEVLVGQLVATHVA